MDEMAGVPDAVVGFLLENLKDLVLHNADLIAGAEKSAKSVIEELEVLKALLKKFSEEYIDEDFLDKLAKRTRNLVYRAEDAIETYIVNTSKQKSRGVVRVALFSLDRAMELRNIVKELETITKEVQNLYTYTDKASLGFRALQLDSAKGQERRVRKPPVDDDMVGFEDAMEKVMKLLIGGPEDVQIVSIVGMLGLGKTTLARKVFNQPTVEYHFFSRVYVEVSAEYNAKEVFLKILRSCGNITYETTRMSEDELVQNIRDYLKTRNFLVVLDDVWTLQAWDDLKRAFPENRKQSRVLITTQIKRVAEYASRGCKLKPYFLRFLRPEESQELLRRKVFGGEPFPSNLAEQVPLILNRCDGLPLAIVVTAGILIKNWKEGHWWRKVAENEDAFDLKTLQQVIKLSFNNLPYRLKPCFLYLGVFPERSEIHSKTLLQLWVSEGFVRCSGEESSMDIAEDIAEGYLEELVERHLVMVEKRRLNGRIKTIRIHNTLREFCRAEGIKEEFFREIKRSESGSNISPDDDRRLCINSNVFEYIKSKPSGKYVRSFLSFAKEDFSLPREYVADIPKAFKLVRVLDIRKIRLTGFPAELYYSFLLKYIAMSVDFKIIPDKMSNLKYLQTLIVNSTQPALEIKADIWKMAQLRHLETNTSTTLVETKEAVSTNSNLQTLSKISPESCRKEVFDRAPQLKKLGISGTLAPVLEVTGQGSLFDTLSKLEFLENLKLLNDNTAVKLCSLPRENSFPPKLTKLTLQNTKLDWGHMSTLGKLKKLEVLKLNENAFLGEFWETKYDGFRALKVLHIGGTDLTTWNASASHFPSLTHLYLKHCANLVAIPSDLVSISTLHLVDIYRCNSSVAASARKLQLVKLQMQAQDKDNRSTTLKLSIYPPE